MLMIDPKMVELSPYKRVPHLMHPVITDMKKAEAVLGWAVDKMEERYDLLARCGVRHLDSYNELGRDTILRKLGLDPNSDEAEQVPERMPYIVIIADEMADMMMTSGKEVEGFIIRLAQKSRAVGIHLVLATQKPTVDVITGLIKSNLPARIAFQVASRVDSRVVLDEMGAERLLGNGDMLYLIPGTSKMTRAQGTYVSDNEVNAVIEFFGDCEPEYSRELAQLSTRPKGKSGIDAIRSRDEMYEQAIDVVVREGRGKCFAAAAGPGDRLWAGSPADRLYGRRWHRRRLQRVAGPRGALQPRTVGRAGRRRKSDCGTAAELRRLDCRRRRWAPLTSSARSRPHFWPNLPVIRWNSGPGRAFSQALVRTSDCSVHEKKHRDLPKQTAVRNRV